ncbi:hypothetical protein Ciccas_006234 [Cichlidogyrus casuarinus]|uniref:DUF3668 domain-containing protein n=1 Tax=Cichlidogyrus casuarinus TaxID=1844966 RepID=A0ABD2Q6Q3_9PLAT
MHLQDRFLVVVALINGRRFPQSTTNKLIVEAKFDKEVLSTDPIDLSIENVKIEQELAWELNKKSLREHKIHRTSIKLQLFLIDATSPAKEPFGYVVLDIRSASSKKQFKWIPVLNTGQKAAPEIFCAVYIDGDGFELVSSDPRQTALAQSVGSANLVPVKLESDAAKIAYVIGPKNLAFENFEFAVRLVSISDIVDLIPSDKKFNSNEIAFTLKFPHVPGLAQESVKFESGTFTELSSHDFSNQTFTVEIQSTVDLLKLFFSRSNFLTFELFADNVSLGKASIDLRNFMAGVDHAFLIPISTEFKEKLQSSEMAGASANLDVTVELSRSKSKVEELTDEKRAKIVAPKIYKIRKHSHLESQVNHFTLIVDFKRLIWHCKSPQWHPNENNFVSFQYNQFGMKSTEFFEIPSPNSQDAKSIADATFHYEFLATWSDLEKIFSTNPLTLTITSNGKEIQANFNLLELLRNSKKESSKDYDNYNLESKLPFRGSEFEHECGAELLIEMNMTDHGEMPLALASKYRNKNNKGERRRDRTHSNHEVRSRRKEGERSRAHSVEELRANRKIAIDESVLQMGDIRETNEYKAALELEMWKGREEERFMKHLQEHERTTMETIAQEWHQRDQERESICKRKLKEYQTLEDQARNLLLNLKEREQQLMHNEANLKRMQRDLQQEHEAKLKQARGELTRKVKQAEQMVQLEKQQTEHWKAVATENQNRIGNMEKEVSRMKTQKLLRPKSPSVSGGNGQANKMQLDYEVRIAKLAADLSHVKSEYTQLECKMSGATLTAKKYRQMWARALEEISRLRKQLEVGAEKTIRDKDSEIKSLKAMIPSQNVPAWQPLEQDVATMEDDTKENFDNDEVESAKRHIDRLLMERHSLLDSGVYELDDEIIKDLDQEIEKTVVTCSALAKKFDYKIDDDGKGSLLPKS